MCRRRGGIWPLPLALVTIFISAVKLSATTIYVPGPTTNFPTYYFKTIGAGAWHGLGILTNGTVVAWGLDNTGQAAVPGGLTNVVAVAAGDNHSLALKSNGTVVAWGDNTYGETNVPNGLSNVVAIAAGGYHSLALRSDGTVVTWGVWGFSGTSDPSYFHYYGQATVPGGLSNVVAVAAGSFDDLALKSDGTVVAWSPTNIPYYDFGQANVPGGLSNVVAVAAGIYHSLALMSDGTLVAWGDNSEGECNVGGLSGVTAISARMINSEALKSDGTVVTWGYPLNQNPVPGMTNTVAVAAGAQFALALKSDHTLAATGATTVPGTGIIMDHNIQDAVNAASDGDTVLVAPGEYKLGSPVTNTKAITLKSEAGAGQTVLQAMNSAWCLWLSNSLAVADGFTLSGGRFTYSGGGAFSAGATIQNCVFTNTVIGPGPGTVTMVGGVLRSSVVDYLINPAGFYPTAVYCTGGGLVTDCQVLGSGVGNGGAEVYLDHSQLTDSYVTGAGRDPVASPGPAVSAVFSTITGCTIAHHGSGSAGGGAWLNNCLMDRCTIAYNSSCANGGGIFETNSTIRDSLITFNGAIIAQPGASAGLGGGVYMQGGALVNCTVSENGANNSDEGPGQGGGVYVESGGITNSIIYFNYSGVGANWTNAGSGVFDHSCTTPDPGGAGNVVQDPQFANPGNGDFHLASSSPCIATGVVQSWMTGAEDLDGNPRIANGEVDRGAYERPLPPVSQTVTADFVASPNVGAAPAAVQFTDNSSGPVTVWNWSFGDGQSVTNTSNVSVKHTYLNAGTYTASLTVSGPGGANSVTQTRSIDLFQGTSPTIASMAQSGGNLVLSGTNGAAGMEYRVLMSTNLSGGNWIPVFTNQFLSDGSFSCTGQTAAFGAGYFRVISP